MLLVKNIRIAITYRYHPGLGTTIKGILSADIHSDEYSTHCKSIAFSGIAELGVQAKFLNTYQQLVSIDEMLELLTDIDISSIESDNFFVRPDMIDTQLSELKLFSSILLSIEFPIGRKYENSQSYSLLEVSDLTFENETMYTLFAREEYQFRNEIRKQIGKVNSNLLLREEQSV